jgi:short-subunit dehydrogenase
MIQSFIQNFGAEGTIINLVSLAAALSEGGSTSYSSGKLALINIGQNLAKGTNCSTISSYLKLN